MGYVNFYLDKPFEPEVSKAEIKNAIKENVATGKPYPKSILNSRQNSIYLFFSPEKGSRLKIKTSYKASGYQWDFKNARYRSAIGGSLELNNDLNDLASKVLKSFSKLKEEKKIISEDDIKALLKNCIEGDRIISDSKLEKAILMFIERKTGILTNGTLKEYRTIFKSLRDFQIHKSLTLSFNDFNQSFFNEYERFLVNKKNPFNKERGLLNDTIHKYCSTLKSFLEWCYDEGFISSRNSYSRTKTKIKRKAKK